MDQPLKAGTWEGREWHLSCCGRGHQSLWAQHFVISAVLVHFHLLCAPSSQPQSSLVQTLLILCRSPETGAIRPLLFFSFYFAIKSLPLLHFVLVCVLRGMCGCVFLFKLQHYEKQRQIFIFFRL